jgi:transposase
LSTKIHTLVDALGNPINCHLTGGEAHDLVGADHLLTEMQADTLIADTRRLTPTSASSSH